MKNFLILATTLVLSCITLPAAHAQSPQIETLTVQFGDLDLNKPEGVSALFKRIRTAADSVCNHLEGRTLVQKRLYSDCVDTALSTAVTRVDRPVLSEYLVERSDKTRKVAVRGTSSR